MTDKPTRPEVGVSTAVFRDGKVLLAQRAAGALQGLWSLPGGRLEFGERLSECALRELDEEVGVKADIVDFAGIVEVMPRAADPMTLDDLPVTDDLHRIVRLAAALVLPQSVGA